MDTFTCKVWIGLLVTFICWFESCELKPTTLAPKKKKMIVITALRIICCEGETAHLLCSTGKIKILNAEYGRTDHDKCPMPGYDNNVKCYTDEITQTIVRDKCDGKKNCVLKCTYTELDKGHDPCSGTYKYGNVTYKCDTMRPTTKRPRTS